MAEQILLLAPFDAAQPEIDHAGQLGARQCFATEVSKIFAWLPSGTGARSSEMTGATRSQVSFGSTALFQLHGKGRKERTVRLWPQTAKVLHRWFQMLEGDDRTLAFHPFGAPRSRRMPSTTCCSVPSRKPARRVLTWPPSE